MERVGFDLTGPQATTEGDMTRQKLYAILRKAGYMGRNRASEWPHVDRGVNNWLVTWEGSAAYEQQLTRLRAVHADLTTAGIPCVLETVGPILEIDDPA